MGNFCVAVGPGFLPNSSQESSSSVATNRSSVSSGIWWRHYYWFWFLTRRSKGQETGWLSAFVGSEGESQIHWHPLMSSQGQRQTQGGFSGDKPFSFSVLFQGDAWGGSTVQQRQAGVPLVPQSRGRCEGPSGDSQWWGVRRWYLKNPHILTREMVSFLPREQNILSRKVKSKPSRSHCVSSCPSVSSHPLSPLQWHGRRGSGRRGN